MKKSLKPIDKFDWTLCLILIMFFIISCFSIYSGQPTGALYENHLLKQIRWYIIGTVIVAVVMFFDSDQYKRLSWYLYGLGILLLVVLVISPVSQFTPVIKGAKLWFVIPGLGSIQPSEFVKIFLIITLSKVIATHHENHPIKTLKTDFHLLLKLCLTTLPPLVLIVKDDLGTGLVIIAILTGLIFVSGISWKLIAPIYGGGAAFGGIILYLVIKFPQFLEKYLHIEDYKFDRINSWLNPNMDPKGDSYQLYNSILGIGSGLLTGKGFGNRQVYLPESHTDFVFSVIGEEYGFIGGSVVIGLFFILIYHLTKTALDTYDPFNTYLCTGIISMIAFHVFQNVGMTIQVLPITGIPLPFISYGGSSLMGNMFAIGLVFSIRYHHKEYMFSSSGEVNSKFM
ncbi:FtsW/RodA/SpoVE family cell cycle protein [Bacillus massilinigeriensis]|uniref:FtsW/RodA/SpoVE family cell cycle protein n=1 Tax=Bacillus massilionigeriensis TaxID=1805475 RepID=UPI00096B63F9|nr:FtsW/RodA/SpoVE family cell cycle protein [Bacillus massilionigeriensis]